MAIMVPARFSQDASPGERDAFIRLKDAPSTDDWIVLHSLDVARHRRQISGELDFLIMVPGLGVLCVEIKACSKLRRDKGAWFYGTNAKPDYRGPFKQASEAMHSLRSQVVGMRPDLSRVVFWSAVIFPYVEFSQSSTEWHDWQVIDRRSYRTRPLPELLKEILVKARNHLSHCKTTTWFQIDSEEPYPQQCDSLLQLIRPSFEFFESPRSRGQRLDDEVKHFTDEQFSAIDCMEQNPRVLYTGPAGTGKTLLAIEAARRSCAEGRRVLFLCFNKLLGEWLVEQTRDIGSGVTTTTLHKFMVRLVGGRVSDNSTEFWQTTLPQLTLDKLIDSQEPIEFDELIVDESQDVCRSEYLDVLDFVLRGGLAAGRWRFFGDFEKQAIFHSSDISPTVVLGERTQNSAPLYTLRVNCRNRPRVAALVELLAGLQPKYRKVLRPDDRIEPKQRYYHSESEQNSLLVSALEESYEAGFKGRDVVILSPFEGEHCCSAKIKTSPWKERLKPLHQSGKGYIGFGTVHSFKGLEAKCVILTDIESMADLKDQNIFYVGISRALERLVIIASSRAKREIVGIATMSKGNAK